MYKTVKEFDGAVYKFLNDVVSGKLVIQSQPHTTCEAVAHCIDERFVTGLRVERRSMDGLLMVVQNSRPNITRAGLMFIENYVVEG